MLQTTSLASFKTALGWLLLNLAICTFANKQVDKEAFQTVCEIVLDKGYPCEEHSVTTKDGFILGMQRIPRGINSNVVGKPVLLMHGLIDSAHTYINNLAHQSLGFILADAGYDVWLGNCRGNKYSKKHVSLNPKKIEFWKWSWDEMSLYDLPSMLEFVQTTTNVAQIAYVGHSQGTEIAFASLNEKDGVSDKMSVLIALAPVTKLAHVTSPLKLLAPLSHAISNVMNLFGNGEFKTSKTLQNFFATSVCAHKKTSVICSNMVALLGGIDDKYTNVSRLPVYLSHLPAGTSVQNMVHYSQSVIHKEFQRFDYGKNGNIHHYGQPNPPKFGVNNIKTPVVIYHGGEDTLAAPEDVTELAQNLPNLVHIKNVPDYNHMDFVWAVNAREVIYEDILQQLARYA